MVSQVILLCLYIFHLKEALHKFTNSLWHIQIVNQQYYTLTLGTLLHKIKFTLYTGIEVFWGVSPLNLPGFRKIRYIKQKPD